MQKYLMTLLVTGAVATTSVHAMEDYNYASTNAALDALDREYRSIEIGGGIRTYDGVSEIEKVVNIEGKYALSDNVFAAVGHNRSNIGFDYYSPFSGRIELIQTRLSFGGGVRTGIDSGSSAIDLFAYYEYHILDLKVNDTDVDPDTTLAGEDSASGSEFGFGYHATPSSSGILIAKLQVFRRAVELDSIWAYNADIGVNLSDNAQIKLLTEMSFDFTDPMIGAAFKYNF